MNAPSLLLLTCLLGPPGEPTPQPPQCGNGNTTCDPGQLCSDAGDCFAPCPGTHEIRACEEDGACPAGEFCVASRCVPWLGSPACRNPAAR